MILSRAGTQHTRLTPAPSPRANSHKRRCKGRGAVSMGREQHLSHWISTWMKECQKRQDKKEIIHERNRTEEKTEKAVGPSTMPKEQPLDGNCHRGFKHLQKQCPLVTPEGSTGTSWCRHLEVLSPSTQKKRNQKTILS